MRDHMLPLMEGAQAYSSDVAFTPAVKTQQSRKGSRGTYERMERGGSWETAITPDLKNAHVYVGVIGTPEEQHAAMAQLHEARPRLQRELSLSAGPR